MTKQTKDLNNQSIFDNYNQATVWYAPSADSLLLHHKATFFELPCLERADGLKLVCAHPYHVMPEGIPESYQLIHIGEL